jgi:hypothetical protein
MPVTGFAVARERALRIRWEVGAAAVEEVLAQQAPAG